jgi:NADPH:quinone reductase-like Zn-dependent oxidoreductase
MRKVVIHRAGGLEQLRLEEAPEPPPGDSEVAVSVSAIGVNYADCVIRMGLYESARQYVGWPITPGFEVAGRVERVGTGVEPERFAPGDRVVAVTRFDGYATRVVVPAHQVFALPPGMTETQAAAFPTVFLTAWYALHELAHPRAGQRVLVHSAAGGVGSALVQLARRAGCEVTGVVGASRKVEAVRALGADHVIDKSRERLWPAAERIAPQGFHVILDANGVETLGASYRHLAPPGKLVIYGFHTMLPRRPRGPDWIRLAVDYLRTPRFNPLDMTNQNCCVLAFNLSYLFSERAILAESMTQLLDWWREGHLQLPRITPYPFARVADAHRDLQSGQTVGKLVLLTEEG